MTANTPAAIGVVAAGGVDSGYAYVRRADLRSAILSDTEAFIDAKPYPAGAYRNPTSIMGEIRRDGVGL